MAIPVYTFGLSVTCTKMVDRDEDNGVAARYAGADRLIDLTPYLGEAGAVRTSKSMGQCSGSFEISFGDQMDPGFMDSLYARLEPMDMIEIRATRDPHAYVGRDMPLVMRGFLDLVRRSETVGEDNRPRRVVILSGHDFGKLLEIHQVFWELTIVKERPMLTAFGLQAALGLKVEMVGVSQFVQTFVDKVANAKIADLEMFSRQVVKRFVAETSVEQGQIIPSRVGEVMDTTYWGLVSAFADRPWNELFIRDEEDGPHVIFREVPYRGLDGKYIMPTAADPGTVDLDIAEVVQLDVGRSDSRVANFFWTPPGSSSLDSSGYAVVGSLVSGSALDFRHGNNLPELYGERKMQVMTALQPDVLTDLPTRLQPIDQQAAAGTYVPWYRTRARQLQQLNRDNSVLEDGGIVAMGREDYTIGRYLRLTRGDLVSEFYVTGVTHTMQPLNVWTTSLQVERGTGFLTRLRVSDSPYLAENRPGPYS